MTQTEPTSLDTLFSTARAAERPATPAFLETALANAYAAQPLLPEMPASRPARTGTLSFLAGWRAASALAASVLAGFWLGYADWQGIASSGPFATLLPSLDETFSTLDAFDMTFPVLEEQQT
jgi:hypothetical protein